MVKRTVLLMSRAFRQVLLLLLMGLPLTIHGDDLQILLEKGNKALDDNAFDDAARHFTTAAELGDGEAQVKLATMILNGQISGQNPSDAFDWFSKAASSGFVSGMYNLANLYKQGTGTRIDYIKAAHWYKKAALLGDRQAQFELALMFKKGLGVDRTNKRAAYWLEQSAKQSHTPAQASIGLAYITAEGVEQDFSKAVFWLAKAAEADHKAAKNNLGFLYEYGQGVTKDYAKALELYREADSKWSRNRIGIVQRKQTCLLDASTRLFKTEIKCADRYGLSKAIKNGGAVAISEDRGSWGDSYLARSSQFGDSELYVAYTMDNHFAIAQYTFAGAMEMAKVQQMLAFVENTYGEPLVIEKTDLESPVKFTWQLKDGIKLTLSRDWPDKIVELTYTFEDNFNAMLKEQAKQDSIGDRDSMLDNHKGQF